MTNKKEILLEIQNLIIDGFTGEQWVPIIKGVDLQLHKGEVLGLIGESGAGKSTMGAAAMGYARDGTRITDGSIKFSGIELTTASEKQKRELRGAKIAYVAQSAAASFNPAHKIIDQHSEAPRFHNLMTKSESEEDAIDLYNRLQLPYPNEIGFRYPHQVSGGQLQRAMTAMAMSCRPDLIIFDEAALVDGRDAFNVALAKVLANPDKMLERAGKYGYDKAQLPPPDMTTEWACSTK